MTKTLASRFSPLGALTALGLATGCVHSPPSDPWDPIEPVNRAVYKFNDVADRYVLRPIARGYDTVTPQPVQRSVGNFFDNLEEPVNIANSALQLKFYRFNVALGRFMVNTTAGVGGLFDVASAVGVAEVDEDFGQTLGHWGLGQGPYLVLPLLGPSTGRDFTGRFGDQLVYPLTYVEEDYDYVVWSLRALDIIDTRARLLGFEDTVEQQFDPYAFIRGYYLENRLEAVYDGAVPAGKRYDSSAGDEDEAGA